MYSEKNNKDTVLKVKMLESTSKNQLNHLLETVHAVRENQNEIVSHTSITEIHLVKFRVYTN